MDKEYHFFLWTKKECPFCIKAIDELFDEDCKYTEYEMGDKPETLQQVKDRFNWQTVPIILVQCSSGETKFVGGSSDLEDFLDKIVERDNRSNHDFDENKYD